MDILPNYFLFFVCRIKLQRGEVPYRVSTISHHTNMRKQINLCKQTNKTRVIAQQPSTLFTKCANPTGTHFLNTVANQAKRGKVLV